jgi:protein-tyrosine phosphatase
MGNICRSPAAEAIFLERLKEKGLSDKYKVDSAGTIDYHNGETPDKRMIKAANNRGYELNSFARGFDPRIDFKKFDMIISMDRKCLLDLRDFDKEKEFNDKLHLLSDFNLTRKEIDVPDPYYGGPQGFENVLDLVEDGVQGLLEKLEND